MADVVRLSIIYDTGQAASKLNQLNNQLSKTTISGGHATRAAVGLAQALATGNVSAASLTSRLTALGGKAGTVGLIIAAAAGVLLLFKNNADKAREAAFKFQDQLRDTQRAIDDLLRPSSKPELQDQINKITDAITELDRVLSQQRLNIIQRIFGAKDLDEFGRNLLKIGQSIKRFFVGGEKPETRAQRNALGAERGELTTGALAGAISGRATEEFARIRSFGRLAAQGEIAIVADQLGLMEKELQDLLKVLPDDSIQIKQLSADIRDHQEYLRKLHRAQNIVINGLGTLANTLEDFIVTGTLAFTDFLNNILRLLYRDFTGSIIDSIARSLGRATPVGSSGGGDGGTAILGNPGGAGGTMGSVTTNVNINVHTPDASATAAWLNNNGPAIAAVVTAQADRSRGIRRRFLRG